MHRERAGRDHIRANRDLLNSFSKQYNIEFSPQNHHLISRQNHLVHLVFYDFRRISDEQIRTALVEMRQYLDDLNAEAGRRIARPKSCLAPFLTEFAVLNSVEDCGIVFVFRDLTQAIYFKLRFIG